jgi:hypothetical protein
MIRKLIASFGIEPDNIRSSLPAYDASAAIVPS